jgi:hypothetical protein
MLFITTPVAIDDCSKFFVRYLKYKTCLSFSPKGEGFEPGGWKNKPSEKEHLFFRQTVTFFCQDVNQDADLV